VGAARSELRLRGGSRSKMKLLLALLTPGVALAATKMKPTTANITLLPLSTGARALDGSP